MGRGMTPILREETLSMAAKVTGHMHKEELAWLYDTAAGRPMVIEMGSWLGRSSVALSSATKLVCVDWWKGSPVEHHIQAIAAGLDPYKEWTENTRDIRTLRDVTGIKVNLYSNADTSKLIDKLGGCASMVFIDADHEQAKVLVDIETALQLAAPGCLICGHDFNHKGVYSAVFESFGKVINPCKSIWVAEYPAQGQDSR